jgi:hypothetical protein
MFEHNTTDQALAYLWSGEPWTLNGLAAEASAWHAREFPGQSPWTRLAKPSEEAGGLLGEVIKAAEGRDDPAEHVLRAIDEACDVIIAATGAMEALGVTDIDEELARRWATVRQRRHATAAGEPR